MKKWLTGNKWFYCYTFLFLSLLFLSPYLARFLIPLLPRDATYGKIIFMPIFISFMVWFNIGGYVIFVIQGLFGFRLVRIEEFGIVEDTHDKSKLLIVAIVTVWILIAAILALVITKIREAKYRQ